MNQGDRAVAEVLMRIHQDDWGPTGSNPSLQTEVTSTLVQERLEEMQLEMGHDTVKSILRDLAAQDYIVLAKEPNEEDALLVQKVYPARMKRDFNLWHVAEEF